MEIKILADENVDYRIVKHLRKRKINIIHLIEIKRGISDYEVIELAKKLNAIILTEDSDFGTWAYSHKKEINGVLFIRYKAQEYLEIANTIINVLDKYKEDLYKKFVTITKDKIRIREI